MNLFDVNLILVYFCLNLLRDDLEWAYSIVLSRSFSAPLKRDHKIEVPGFLAEDYSINAFLCPFIGSRLKVECLRQSYSHPLVNQYRRQHPKVDASIFDSALSHTRRSDTSEKKKKIARPLLDVFAFGQFSSPRLYQNK